MSFKGLGGLHLGLLLKLEALYFTDVVLPTRETGEERM